ncbi:hypothetical protein JCM10207_004921 [Rhodosporidiobolus poonsookiae]
MTKTLTVTLDASYRETAIQHICPPFSSGTWTISHSIACSNSGNEWLSATLTWSDCSEQVPIVGGSCQVVDAVGQNLASLVLRPGLFPPTTTGTASPGSQMFRHSVNVARYQTHRDLVEEGEVAVCLELPESGHKLFINRKVLEEISPFWQARLASTDFSDRSNSASTFDDSDAEGDLAMKPLFTSEVPSSSRKVSVSGFSYTTYRALLASLYGVPITFAPLRSSYANSEDKSALSSLRIKQLKEYHVAHPELPLPASPKSVYRLAHFLGLSGSARTQALDSLKTQLTAANIAQELFDPHPESLAKLFPEVEAVELEVAKKHAASVCKSKPVEEAENEIIELVTEEKQQTAKWLFAVLNAK